MIYANWVRYAPSTRQDSDPARTTATVVGVITAVAQSVRGGVAHEICSHAWGCLPHSR
jgi:hypothetical protein